MKNHNFPETIKLVLRETDKMAFIALDDKSLETGKLWGSGYNRETGKRTTPKVIEYRNGSFTLKLSKAAESSYGQGKLSFWTLIVTAPDGESFNIGINSESLISTFFESTVTNGEIDGLFYLGRSQGQQSVAKKDGVYYKEYLESIEVKKSPLTKKYTSGDVIINNLTTYIYLGEYKHDIRVNQSNNNSTVKCTIEKKDKPHYAHYYMLIKKIDTTYVDDNDRLYIFSDNTKKGGRVIGNINKAKTDEYMERHKKDLFNRLKKKIAEVKVINNPYASNYWSLHRYVEEHFAIKGIYDIESASKEIKELDLEHVF